MEGERTETVYTSVSRVRRRRVRLATGAALAVVLAAVAVVVVVTRDDGGSSHDRAGAWDRLLARRLDEGLSAQLALDAFATLVGPVPGGRPVQVDSADRTGTTAMTSVTPAVRWMLARWDELDQPQREAFREAVYGQPVGTATGTATAATGTATGAAAGGSSRGGGASTVAMVVGRQPTAEPTAEPTAGPTEDPDRELEQGLQSELDVVAEDFSARAGITLPPVRVVVSAAPHPERPRVLAVADYRFSAAPGSPQGEDRSAECVLTVYPPAIADREGTPSEQDDFVVTMAHELYHCHQFVVEDRAGVDTEPPEWVVEGSAEWAGHWYAAQVAPGFVSTAGFWETYFAWPADEPATSLYRRSYDALGFYAHLDNALAGSLDDTWSTMDEILVAGDSEGSFTTAVQAGGEVFLRQWAMGMFRNPSLGSEWDTTGPGLPDTGPGEVDEGRLTPGGTVPVEVDAAPGVTRAQVDVATDVAVLRAEITGHGAFHWAGPELEERGRTEWFDTPRPEVRWYCFTGECACPEQEPEAPEAHQMPRPSTVSVALTGGTTSAAVELTGTTVEELCDAPDDGPPGDVRPVRDCEDVFEIVRGHADHYDEHREVVADAQAGVTVCSVTYQVAPELDELGNYLELGVLQEITVTFAPDPDPELALCTEPEGYCVTTDTQHVDATEGIPGYDVVRTNVTTAHVDLVASEETHGPTTPTEALVRVAQDIQAGISG